MNDRLPADFAVSEHRRPKRRGRWIVAVLAAVVALVVAMLVWYQLSLRPTKASESSITVREGEAAASIGAQLKERKLIRSARAFEIHVRSKNLAPSFKSGRYVLSGERSTPEIAHELTQGPKQASQFTVKEGVTQDEIAALLGTQDIADESEFKALKAADFPEYDFLKDAPPGARLEGFLFPETYARPEEGTSARAVATIMLNEFGKRVTPELRAAAAASGRTLYQTIIVASLVEEEVKTETDRKLVAGIIYKRLAEDIRLDIDATTRYALGKPTGTLTQNDLDSGDPFNTRKQKGLPPGPICNPGLVAIRAAIEPTASEWLFYLTGRDGKTYFATTNEEHERNKAEHL